MNPDFASVTLSCAKKGCRKPRGLQRHHKGHQYIWVAVWVQRRMAEPKYQKFCRRYWTYDSRDVVKICSWHHAEVHAEYDHIIDRHISKIGKPLHEWSWKQAEALMKELIEHCERWLKKQTPGMNPKPTFKKRSKKRRKK